MSDLTYVYGEIVKSETTADDTRLVHGKAAGPDLDLDGQRCDPRWLSKAMPKWMELGNVREQHGSNAAGVGVELTQDGESWLLKSEIVDRNAVRKVDKKVYKGYSIGIKGARVIKSADAPNGLIVGGEIVEISLVDRPSNPTARMTVCKSAGGRLLPVNELGEMIMGDEQEFTGKFLTADLHKGAVATADRILAKGITDADDSTQTIDGLCDLAIHELMLVKAALVSGDDEVDITTLNKAVEGLTHFVDADVSDYPGGAEGMQDDMDAYLNKYVNGDQGATLVAADLEKAVTGATAPLLEEIEKLRGEIAEVKKAAKPGGPLTMATASRAPKFDRADELALTAKSPGLDPQLAHLYQLRAAEVGQ